MRKPGLWPRWSFCLSFAQFSPFYTVSSTLWGCFFGNPGSYWRCSMWFGLISICLVLWNTVIAVHNEWEKGGGGGEADTERGTGEKSWRVGKSECIGSVSGDSKSGVISLIFFSSLRNGLTVILAYQSACQLNVFEITLDVIWHGLLGWIAHAVKYFQGFIRIGCFECGFGNVAHLLTIVLIACRISNQHSLQYSFDSIAFDYCRDCWHYPLPPISTCRKAIVVVWFIKFKSSFVSGFGFFGFNWTLSFGNSKTESTHRASYCFEDA